MEMNGKHKESREDEEEEEEKIPKTVVLVYCLLPLLC